MHSSRLENTAEMMVLLGYNNSLDKFQLILIALISHEDANIFTENYIIS